MMERREVLVFFVIFLGLLLSCTPATYKPAGTVECPAEIKWQVAEEAQVTHFACAVKNYKGWKRPAVHFIIQVKNKSDKPQRFRVNFILPEQGIAAGGLLPRKGKPPVLKPGKEAKGIYPLRYSQIPKKVIVIIKTVSLD